MRLARSLPCVSLLLACTVSLAAQHPALPPKPNPKLTALKNEAMREIELDLEEGADMILVKPAMPYLDLIRQARDRFDVPVGAYQVTG